MAAFLSDSWIALLDAAVSTLPVPDQPLVIEQVVSGNPSVRYHFVLGPTRCCVVSGAAAEPDILLRVDADTAARLSRGEENAQRALAEGRLKVDGRIDRLVGAGDFLANLGDIYASVREATEYAPVHEA